MKRHVTLTKLSGFALIVFMILTGCKKEDSTYNANANAGAGANNKTSGVIPEDPAKLAKIPMIISSDYYRSQSTAAKKTKPGSGNTGGTGSTGTGSTGGDVTPPNVSITSPSDGASVSGTLSITANASDNVGVSAVSFSVDGSLIGTVYAAPYTISWNTSGIADGFHTITATATDGAKNSGSASISVTKNTTILPPPTNLPSTFTLLMPPVQNQGGEGICAVFSTTYAARSAEQFYRTNASSYSYATNIFSPEFVYNQTKFGDCGSGTGITTALDFLKTTGVCTWQSMPYSSSDGCTLMPTNAQVSEAANYRINSYSWLMYSDISAIKTMLVNKHPVIITIDPDLSFYNAGPGFIWKSYSGALAPSHALVICGYDDAKHAWKVFNSWGTSWGDAGYSWIDYDFLPQAGFPVGYVING